MTNPPSAAAPHRAVERWCEDLLLALRLRDVPGERIGAVLAEVRSHLADSGEDPVEAFGDPVAHAEALTAGAPGRPRPSRRRRLLEHARGTAAVLGTWWVVAGAGALIGGGQARLSAVPVALSVLAALVVPGGVERLVTGRRAARVGWSLAVGAAVTALGVGVAVAEHLTGALSTPAPALALLLPGLALAAWGTVSGGGLRPDPVVEPLASPQAVRRERRSGARWLALAWGLVALTGLVAVALSAWAASA